MKRNELKRIVNFYLSKHRTSCNSVNIYYPLIEFPELDLISFRKVLNALCYDAHCKVILEHKAVIIYTLVLGPENYQKEGFVI